MDDRHLETLLEIAQFSLEGNHGPLLTRWCRLIEIAQFSLEGNHGPTLRTSPRGWEIAQFSLEGNLGRRGRTLSQVPPPLEWRPGPPCLAPGAVRLEEQEIRMAEARCRERVEAAGQDYAPHVLFRQAHFLWRAESGLLLLAFNHRKTA